MQGVGGRYRGWGGLLGLEREAEACASISICKDDWCQPNVDVSRFLIAFLV